MYILSCRIVVIMPATSHQCPSECHKRRIYCERHGHLEAISGLFFFRSMAPKVKRKLKYEEDSKSSNGDSHPNVRSEMDVRDDPDITNTTSSTATTSTGSTTKQIIILFFAQSVTWGCAWGSAS